MIRDYKYVGFSTLKLILLTFKIFLKCKKFAHLLLIRNNEEIKLFLSQENDGIFHIIDQIKVLRIRK